MAAVAPASGLAADLKSDLPEPAEICPGCQRPVVRRGSHGECARCLLNFALFEDEPGPDEISAGPAFLEQCYGHFKVAVAEDGLPFELGAGATAITYRAHDTVLNCFVALKVIKRGLAEHPAARARFLREARAAARLRHPNVASVIHYGEQDGRCFYAMELVEGETLEATVRRDGPLSAALALEIAVQVAGALTAAEAGGVVHRDLKPSNLMLAARAGESGEGETLTVKVIDWGLAKAVTAGAPLGPDHTRDGFLGTPAFASPEQFARGKDLPIDTRADIYSLGVTLWYLLCGQTPYAGRTLQEIHHRRTHQPLPLAQLAAVRVPRPLVRLLETMLAPDPAARPQSARQLLQAVRRARERSLRARRVKAWVRGHRWGMLAVAALLAAAGSVWWQNWRGSSPRPARPSLAVLPFDNLSPAPDDAFYASGMQREIVAESARVAGWTVINAGGSRFYPAAKRDRSRIGRQLGAAYLLEGNVRRVGGRARVAVSLVDLRNPSHPWTHEDDRPLAEASVLPGEIALAVAGRMRVTLSARERAALAASPPTRQPAAYDLYLRATGEPVILDDDDDDEAQHSLLRSRVALLEAATANDPDFAPAYCDLAKAHDELGVLEAQKEGVDHGVLATAALARAKRLSPGAGEIHLAQAVHFLETDHQVVLASRELDLARLAMPNSAEVEEVSASIARRQGRWADALLSLKRALALEPHASVHLLSLAALYRLLRQYDDFDLTMHQLIEQVPAQEAYAYRLYRALGPLESRADLAPLRAALAITPDDEPAKGRYALILSLYAHDTQGLSRLLSDAGRTQYRINGAAYPKRWFEALAAQMRGDESGVRVNLAAARADLEKATAGAADVRCTGLLAVIDALLGHREEAVRGGLDAVKDVSAAGPSVADLPVAASNLALVYAWTDQPDLAFAELEKCVGQPAGLSMLAQPTYGDLRLDPLWAPLRKNPRFAALVEGLAPSGLR